MEENVRQKELEELNSCTFSPALTKKARALKK